MQVKQSLEGYKVCYGSRAYGVQRPLGRCIYGSFGIAGTSAEPKDIDEALYG